MLDRPSAESPLQAVGAAISESGLLAAESLDRDRARTRLRLVRENPSLLPRQLAQYAHIEAQFTEALAERMHVDPDDDLRPAMIAADRKSTRLNSSHVAISYAVFCF